MKLLRPHYSTSTCPIHPPQTTSGTSSTGERGVCSSSQNFHSSPVTHQTRRQQGGTGEDGYSHLADWTLGVAAIEKKKDEDEDEEEEEQEEEDEVLEQEDEEEEEEEEECPLSYVGPPQNNKCIYTGEQVSKSLDVLRPVKHYGKYQGDR